MIYIPSNLNKGFEIFIKEYKRGQRLMSRKIINFFYTAKKTPPTFESLKQYKNFTNKLR